MKHQVNNNILVLATQLLNYIFLKILMIIKAKMYHTWGDINAQSITTACIQIYKKMKKKWRCYTMSSRQGLLQIHFHSHHKNLMIGLLTLRLSFHFLFSSNVVFTSFFTHRIVLLSHNLIYLGSF